MAKHVQFDREKLRAVILHVVRTVRPEHVGAVKLHKVLYLVDMLYFAQTGRAVTGAEYRKRPFGPTCVPLLSTLRDLEREGCLRASEESYFGFRKTRYEALGAPDLTRLGEDEVALLDEVADFVCNGNSARMISEFSHQQPWELTAFDGVIGYETALLLFPAEPSPEAFELVEREAPALEETRSRHDPLGFTFLEDFRSRVLAEAGAARA